MKIFVLAPKEDWICDRLVSEWYAAFPEFCTKNINDADIVWLLAGWCWNHLPVEILKNKKIIVTEHHIVPEKFTQQKYQNFMMRDQFVNCYHVPNEKTKSLLGQLTNKRIEVISYWYNDKLWYPIDKTKARKELDLSIENYYIGSFQRDTEGSDLKTPKLEKGPDLFCDYLIRNRSKIEVAGELHVLLGGWRRQYVEGGPQAIIEASSMKVPIISTDVGIANQILHKNCIIDIEKDYYVPNSKDLEYAFSKVSKLSIKRHGKKFIKLFKEVDI